MRCPSPSSGSLRRTSPPRWVRTRSQEAKTAALIGLLVVALFLIVFYRLLGVVAVTGLAIYVAFMYAAILILNVTLTLPGFAGLILTIGVAADANVVIFERIKEEVRAGKSTRAAIATGYQKGFHTIVDANVVTAITALVLFAVATAQVKGFALMLLIGTVMSVLTAVVATRAMLGLLGGFRWFDNPHFMGAEGQGIAKWQRIDVNSRGRRRIWLSIATVAIVLSVLAVFVKGLNFGIDFKGGTQITFRTPEATPIAEVREQMRSIGRADAVVQGRGESAGGDRFQSFQVRTKSLTEQQQNDLANSLENNLGATSSSVKNVSSSFSRQIAKGAIYAVVVSFILIMIYISLRFQWRFAVPILRTLFSDILITLGIYAMSGREVTTATVAAVLTVLGYSIYDTIIVFDRVRENIPLMRRASFATIANVSLWETMRRSLATTFITLIPIASLLLFGGETLKDFAFALFVGIGLGAVSTFFVATPFLTVLMERASRVPRAHRRRRDGEGRRRRPSRSRRRRRPRSSPHRLPSVSARRRWPLLRVTAPRRGSRSGSSAGSGDARGHMDEQDKSPRELAERLGLLAVGAVALTAERIDELAGELAERGGMQRDEVRQLIEEAVARWRGDATRLTARAGQGLQGIFVQLGLVDARRARGARAAACPGGAPSAPRRRRGGAGRAVRARLRAWLRARRHATSAGCPRSHRSRSSTASATSSPATS